MGAVIAVIAHTAYMYFAGREAAEAITGSGQNAAEEHVFGPDVPGVPVDNDSITTGGSGIPPEHITASHDQLNNHPEKPADTPSSSRPHDDDQIADGETGADSPISFLECLTKSIERIVGELKELDDIIGYLVLQKAITENQTDVIRNQKKGREKVMELLRCVQQRGEEACRGFVAALRDTDQLQLCELSASLKKELDKLPASDVLGIDKYMTEMKEEYKEQIKDKSKIEEEHYGNRVSLKQHVPVIIKHGHQQPARQTRVGFDDFSIETKDRNELSLDTIFTQNTDRHRPHSVLMLGSPGMGKTSLCFNILNRFVRSQWGGHQFIFFLLLKEFGDMTISLSIADLLFSYNRKAPTKAQIKKFIQQLDQQQSKILFILDGYDEIPEFMTGTRKVSDYNTKDHIGDILRNLVQGYLFKDSQVLITSRPFRQTDMRVDRVVELAGLSQKSVYDVFGGVLSGELLLESGTFLKKYKDVASMLCIPVNLQKFLSYLVWLQDTNAQNVIEKLPKTKTSLYSKQMLPVIRQCLRLKGVHQLPENEMWKHPVIKAFLHKLAELAGIALNNFGEKQIIFELSDLEKCKLTEDEVKTGGLMASFTQKTMTSDGLRLSILFYFTHLTTFEWFGGLNTASRDFDYIADLIKRNNGVLDVILIFAAGLLGSSDGQRIMECLFRITEDECIQKAHKMLDEVVNSERCGRSGGSHFALELLWEGEFVNPRPLLPLLAPDRNVLQLTHIAQANQQAVGYFVQQLNSLQDEQKEATGTPDSEIGLDTVRLHFTEAANSTVQNSLTIEVCKLKKLKHLLIETDGHCEVVVESPLEMLLMHGTMTGDSAARVVETSRASTLCLYTYGGLCNLTGSTRLTRDTQEIHLMGLVFLHSDTLTSMVTSSLRAITGLWYNDVTAAALRHVIEKTPALRALGLWLDTRDAAGDYRELSRVVSASRVACLSLLRVKPDAACHMEVIRDLLDNASSLRELWLAFFSAPSDADLVNLARWVCRHGRLIRLSLVCLLVDPVNVTCFLRQLAKKPHSVRHIYTDGDVRSVDRDDVSFMGELQEVRGGPDAAFYTPLVNSDYLLTSIPSHVKQVLTRRYVSPD